MIRNLLVFLILLIPCSLWAQDAAVMSAAKDRPAIAPPAFRPKAVGAKPDPLPRMAKGEIEQLSFVDMGRSKLHFPIGNESFTPLYSKFAALLSGSTARVNILHIGGSHVQGGTLSNTIRLALATSADATSGRSFGGASRGMIFPFKILNTNAPADYTISSSGYWEADKNISRQPLRELGLSGAVAYTSDPLASLSVDVKSNLWAFSELRIVGESTSPDCFPIVTVDGQEYYPIRDHRPGYLFAFPRSTTRCSISFSGIDGMQEFRLRGIIPESDNGGICYTGAGINGAAVPSWLRCSLFKEELELLSPDLVVFGIGINDASGTVEAFSVEAFKQNYRLLIDRIRSVNPRCAFLFITNNDCWYQKRPNQNTPRAEQAFLELAEETGGAVFNVYRIMGGLGSSDQWVAAGYMSTDHIHFTRQGYSLIGNLLANALLTDFEQFQWKK